MNENLRWQGSGASAKTTMDFRNENEDKFIVFKKSTRATNSAWKLLVKAQREFFNSHRLLFSLAPAKYQLELWFDKATVN